MGQVAVGLMVNPPTSGPELKAYEKEKKEKLASLERRANKVAAALDALEGVSCVRPQGAMYLFPSITLPDAAVKAAKRSSMAPDAFYALHCSKARASSPCPAAASARRTGPGTSARPFCPPRSRSTTSCRSSRASTKSFLAKYGGGGEPLRGAPVQRDRPPFIKTSIRQLLHLGADLRHEADRAWLSLSRAEARCSTPRRRSRRSGKQD